MSDIQMRRRRFLVAAVSIAGLGTTPIPVSMLRNSAAWAEDEAGEKMRAHLATMAQLARRLFPYSGLPDNVFHDVVNEALSMTSADPSSENLLQSVEDELDAQRDQPWLELDENEQIKVLEEIQESALFAAVLGLVRFRLHYHPSVWELLDYPGSSVEYGGYIDRGFDDIDWLPGAR